MKQTTERRTTKKHAVPTNNIIWNSYISNADELTKVSGVITSKSKVENFIYRLFASSHFCN